MVLKPLLDDARIKTYTGRYQVQLEIPSESELTDSDLDLVGRLSSWDLDPNDCAREYEGGRSMIIARQNPRSWQDLTLSALQISGIGYREMTFTTNKPSNVSFIPENARFLPPTNQNAMDFFPGSVMTTSRSENGTRISDRPVYRALGTYTRSELQTKITKTRQASGIRLKNIKTPVLEAYGRYIDDNLKDSEGEFGFLVMPVPDIVTKRASEEILDRLAKEYHQGESPAETIFKFWAISQVYIQPFVLGLREMHDDARIAHLQAHLSNYYLINGFPYLMDWSTSVELRDNPKDNIFHRVVDFIRPKENFNQLMHYNFNRCLPKSVLETISMSVTEGVLETYSKGHQEISYLDVITRAADLLGSNQREIEAIIQWAKDQGLEGYEKHEPTLHRQSSTSLDLSISSLKKPSKQSSFGFPNSFNSKDQGRNTLCSCGSGKKFKRCCMKHK